MIFMDTIHFGILFLICRIFTSGMFIRMGFEAEMSAYATKTIMIVNPFTYFEILRYQYICFA